MTTSSIHLRQLNVSRLHHLSSPQLLSETSSTTAPHTIHVIRTSGNHHFRSNICSNSVPRCLLAELSTSHLQFCSSPSLPWSSSTSTSAPRESRLYDFMRAIRTPVVLIITVARPKSQLLGAHSLGERFKLNGMDDQGCEAKRQRSNMKLWHWGNLDSEM
ncbi:hypothetical protein IQ06DRAFT_111133 [Phaeosphaeriaceae sp. SRC1lsM3a]|nr:hypothetical protein IQ06DRAFT_111133 [Stagonospora sp. SRC1lsM3a]